MKIEVTPALLLKHERVLYPELHLIPARESGQWQVTDVLLQKLRVQELSVLYPNLKDYIRLWKRLMKEAKLPLSSYVVTSAVLSWLSTTQNWRQSHEEKIIAQHVHWTRMLEVGHILDMSGNGKNLLSRGNIPLDAVKAVLKEAGRLLVSPVTPLVAKKAFRVA